MNMQELMAVEPYPSLEVARAHVMVRAGEMARLLLQGVEDGIRTVIVPLDPRASSFIPERLYWVLGKLFDTALRCEATQGWGSYYLNGRYEGLWQEQVEVSTADAVRVLSSLIRRWLPLEHFIQTCLRLGISRQQAEVALAHVQKLEAGWKGSQ